TAGLLVVGGELADSVGMILAGLVVRQLLQAASVFAAGLLAGAGQRRGLLFGAVVGVWNAVFFILLDMAPNVWFLQWMWTGHSLNTIDLFGQPVLHVAFGAMGGLVGSVIWRAPALVLMPVQPRT